MNLKVVNNNFVCCACKQCADFGFEVLLGRRFFNNIKICKDCANKIYLDLSKHFVHKGIKNINKEIKLINKNF